MTVALILVQTCWKIENSRVRPFEIVKMQQKLYRGESGAYEIPLALPVAVSGSGWAVWILYILEIAIPNSWNCCYPVQLLEIPLCSPTLQFISGQSGGWCFTLFLSIYTSLQVASETVVIFATKLKVINRFHQSVSPIRCNLFRWNSIWSGRGDEY